MRLNEGKKRTQLLLLRTRGKEALASGREKKGEKRIASLRSDPSGKVLGAQDKEVSARERLEFWVVGRKGGRLPAREKGEYLLGGLSL